MIKQYFLLASKNLLHRQLRSWLTIIGVIIGIMAIVALFSISSGLKGSIEEQFQKMGSSRLYVMPKSISSFMPPASLTKNDADAISKLSEAKWVNSYLVQTTSIEFNNKVKNLAINSMNVDNLEERWKDLDFSIDKGRLFSNEDKYSAIIGKKVSEDTFDKKVIVNDNLEIKGVKFKVIGIFTEFGNPEDDSAIFIPIDTAREVFDKPTELNIIEIIVKDGISIEPTAKKVERLLLKERGEKQSALKRNKVNFAVITPEQLLGQMNDILLIIQIVLIGIASISLIVGAIGIMNSMYTSVLERTRDIGIMKSIGAKTRTISMLFIVESAIIGFIGGAIGIFLGILISQAVGVYAAQAGFGILKIKIDFILITFSLLFAIGIGIISGYLPASKAAKLQPVEALRY